MDIVDDTAPADAIKKITQLIDNLRRITLSLKESENAIANALGQYGDHRTTQAWQNRNSTVAIYYDSIAQVLDYLKSLYLNPLIHGEEFKGWLIQIKDEVAKAEEISSTALNTATNAAGISAAAPLVEQFNNRITELRNSTNYWLFAAGVSLGLSIICLIFFYFTGLAVNSPSAIAFLLTTRVLIISLLLGVAAWCAKMFKVSYYQIMTYQHKAALTRTYQAFMIAAKDDQQLKQGIMHEALKNIFSPIALDTSPAKTEIEIFESIAKATNNRN